MANPLFTPTPPSSLSLLFVSTTPHFFPCQLLYSSPPSPLHSELADDFTLVLLVAASRAASHSSLLSYPLQSTESVVCALSYGLLRVLLRTHGPQALHCQLTLGAGKPCAVHVSVWLLPLGYGLDGSATSFSWICGGTGSEDSQSITPPREHISAAQTCMCDSQRTCKGTAFCV